MAFDLVTGDTLTVLRISVVDEAGAAFNMDGMTAKFRWKDATGVAVEKAATIAANVASYQFGVGDVFAPQMRIELEVTNAGGKIVSSDSLIILNVREAVG